MFKNYQNYYPNASHCIGPPLNNQNYSYGRAVQLPQPEYKYVTQRDSMPYVGKQFMIKYPTEWGYQRRAPRRMASTLPAPSSPSNQAMRATTTVTVERRTPNSVTVDQAVYMDAMNPPRAPLVDNAPLQSACSRTQRNGFARNTRGGYWTDFDPNHC